MHLMQKCILAVQKCIFASHFPKENVQQRCAKTHLMQKCIWCKNAFLQRITFYEVKCSASHFPKENVQQNKMWCKNVFDAKMHFGVHFPKENVQRTFSFGKCSAVQKCCVFCFAKNKDAYILFCWTFSKGKCSAKQNVTNAFDAVQKCIFASHFVTQNVTNAFWHQMQRSHRKKIKIILKKLYWYESEES